MRRKGRLERGGVWAAGWVAWGAVVVCGKLGR